MIHLGGKSETVLTMSRAGSIETLRIGCAHVYTCMCMILCKLPMYAYHSVLCSI